MYELSISLTESLGQSSVWQLDGQLQGAYGFSESSPFTPKRKHLCNLFGPRPGLPT